MENNNLKITLVECGDDKIKAIGIVRKYTGFGLAEAKELVESVPKVLKTGCSANEAEEIKNELELIGATLKIETESSEITENEISETPVLEPASEEENKIENEVIDDTINENNEADKTSNTVEEVSSETNKDIEPKTSNIPFKKIISITLAAVAVIIVLIIVIINVSWSSDYKKGIELLNQGNYSEAEEIFYSLGLDDYKDSDELENYAEYMIAVDLANKGNYIDAMNQFESLGLYEDSQEKIGETLKLAAKNYFSGNINSEAFDSVLDCFSEIQPDNFSDFEDLYFLRVCELYEMKNYSLALDYLNKIPYYNDGGKIENELRYMSAVNYANNGEIARALNMFETLAEKKYRNSLEHARGIREVIYSNLFMYKDENLTASFWLTPKEGSYSEGIIMVANSSTGQLQDYYSIYGVCFYDGLVVIREKNNQSEKETWLHTTSQTGTGSSSVFKLSFTDGYFDGYTFTSEDAEHYTYKISEKSDKVETDSIIAKIKVPYSEVGSLLQIKWEELDYNYSCDGYEERYANVDFSNLNSTSFTSKDDAESSIISLDVEESTSTSKISTNIEETTTEKKSNDFWVNLFGGNSDSSQNDNLNDSYKDEDLNEEQSDYDYGYESDYDYESDYETDYEDESYHIHEFVGGSCSEYATCACGAKDDRLDPHSWEPSTCTKPTTCIKCGKTRGEPSPHVYYRATCSEPQTCKDCGATNGEPLAHSYTYGFCQYCNEKMPGFITPTDIFVDYKNTIYDENCVFRVVSYEINNIEDYYYGRARLDIKMEITGASAHLYTSSHFSVEFYDENGSFISSSTRGTSGVGYNGIITFSVSIPANCRRIAIVEYN